MYQYLYILGRLPIPGLEKQIQQIRIFSIDQIKPHVFFSSEEESASPVLMTSAKAVIRVDSVNTASN